MCPSGLVPAARPQPHPGSEPAGVPLCAGAFTALNLSPGSCGMHHMLCLAQKETEMWRKMTWVASVATVTLARGGLAEKAAVLGTGSRGRGGGGEPGHCVPRLPSIPTLGTACFLRGGVLNQGPQYWNHSTGLPPVQLPPLPSSVCATSAVLPLPDPGTGTSWGLWLLVQEHGANDVFL